MAACLLQEATPNYEQSKGRRQTKPNRLGGNRKLIELNGRDYIAYNGQRDRGYKLETWMRKANHEIRKGPGGGRQAFRDYLEDLEALADNDAIGLQIEIQGHPRDPLQVLQSYRDNPQAVYRLTVKKYLPADLEERLRQRLEEDGIYTTDEGAASASVVTPARPGGLTPADIRQARKAAGWTQTELAVKVGVSHKQISLWERAKEPIPTQREEKLRDVLRDYLEAEDLP